MLTKNQRCTAQITGYSAEGLGVCRVEGQVVFVHGAVRGETCRIQLMKVLKKVAYARVEEVLTPSPARIVPDCPHFGRCGGCQFRHVTYEEELLAKGQRVEDALARLAGVEGRTAATLPSPQVDRYRNKAQFPISPEGAVGFYRPRSHQVLDVEDCPLQSPAANAAAAVVRAYMARRGVPGYRETDGTGELRHLYVRTNGAGESLICLVCRTGRLPGDQELVEELRRRCAPVAGVVVNINPRDTNVVLGERYRTLWGADHLEDTLCGHRFSLSPAAFYQVNRLQAERLYAAAVELAELTGRERVLELYCGAGTITLALAAHAARVLGVEVVPQAVENARENARRNGVENVEFLLGDAGTAAEALAARGERPDVVVVDPPRKGLDAAAVAGVIAMAPRRIVYVSCDPGTLARDVALLSAGGYALREARPVDMFPRTAHVETVASLVKI